jgi:hypothetical protein
VIDRVGGDAGRGGGGYRSRLVRVASFDAPLSMPSLVSSDTLLPAGAEAVKVFHDERNLRIAGYSES